MKLTARISVSVALLVLLGTSTGCDKLKSRDQINKGVAAFKNAQYEEAVSNFQTAVRLDPTSENAKLYLATSYAYQVVPNLLTPENLDFAQKALVQCGAGKGPERPDGAEAGGVNRSQHPEVR
jgi:tetratricopeptide (TPR) repeat protein